MPTSVGMTVDGGLSVKHYGAWYKPVFTDWIARRSNARITREESNASRGAIGQA
jgi:hypothetical protein